MTAFGVRHDAEKTPR